MEHVDLPALLRQMLTDIQDPNCSYWLHTNYFDIMPPTERRDTRWYMAPSHRIRSIRGPIRVWGSMVAPCGFVPTINALEKME